jgi:hypothetical protein
MDMKDKGVLIIEIGSNDRKRVIFNPVNETVWLTKCELVELFGVYRQTINACIDAIFKANTIHADEHCKCNLIASTGKGGIKYDPYEFNLMFVIAMAFRIDSENAEILRKWILSRMLVEKAVFLPMAIMTTQNYEWN